MFHYNSLESVICIGLKRICEFDAGTAASEATSHGSWFSHVFHSIHLHIGVRAPSHLRVGGGGGGGWGTVTSLPETKVAKK